MTFFVCVCNINVHLNITVSSCTQVITIYDDSAHEDKPDSECKVSTYFSVFYYTVMLNVHVHVYVRYMFTCYS